MSTTTKKGANDLFMLIEPWRAQAYASIIYHITWALYMLILNITPIYVGLIYDTPCVISLWTDPHHIDSLYKHTLIVQLNRQQDSPQY